MSSGVSACGFAAAGVFAGHAEMAPWLCLSPRRCRVRASGWPGSRTGRSPAGVAGAGGVLDAGAREPMIEACGGRLPRSGVLRVCGCRHPMAGRPAGQAAGCIHPFVCPRHGWPGGMGRVRVRDRAGPIRRAPAPPGRAGRAAGPGGGAECSAASRPVAGGRIAGGRAPGRRAVMRPAVAAAWQGGGRARRACRSRPG